MKLRTGEGERAFDTAGRRRGRGDRSRRAARVRWGGAAALVALLLTAGCQQQVGENLEPQSFGMRLTGDNAAKLLALEARPDGVVLTDYGWWAPIFWAFGETWLVDDTDGGQRVLRAERWDAVLLSIFFARKDTANWMPNGDLLYRWGTESTIGGVIHSRTWHDVTAADGERRVEEQLSVLLGLVSIGRDQERRMDLRVFGLRVL